MLTVSLSSARGTLVLSSETRASILALNPGKSPSPFVAEDHLLIVPSMMCIAVLLLNAGHPGYAFRKSQEEATEEKQAQDQDLA